MPQHPSSHQRHDVVEATFDPQRRQTLSDEALTHVGLRTRWTAGWDITEEDGGPYVGQLAWIPLDMSVTLGWVPTEDLTDVEASVP